MEKVPRLSASFPSRVRMSLKPRKKKNFQAISQLLKLRFSGDGHIFISFVFSSSHNLFLNINLYFFFHIVTVNCYQPIRVRLVDKKGRANWTLIGQAKHKIIEMYRNITSKLCSKDGGTYGNYILLLLKLLQNIHVFALTGCGSVMNNTLTTPIYQSNCPGDIHCVYKVTIPQGMALKIDFQYFHVVDASPCR